LKCLTSWVDQEAYLVREEVKDQKQKEYHSQIVQILMPFKMNANNLPYNSIPYLRNQAFHARTELLMVLSSQLREPNRNEGVAQVALCGLGGVGKTQIALEYAYLHFQDYTAIFWINAETGLKLAESFSAQATALGLGNGDTLEHHKQLRAVFKKWLLDSSS
jgi:DNA replication protein DnaC